MNYQPHMYVLLTKSGCILANFFCFWVFIHQDKAEVIQIKQKKLGPISSHCDWNSLVNKALLYSKKDLVSWDKTPSMPSYYFCLEACQYIHKTSLCFLHLWISLQHCLKIIDFVSHVHSSIKSFYLQDGQQQLEKVDPHEYCLLATSALWGILSGILCEYTDHMFAVGEPRKITTIYSHHNIHVINTIILSWKKKTKHREKQNKNRQTKNSRGK